MQIMHQYILFLSLFYVLIFQGFANVSIAPFFSLLVIEFTVAFLDLSTRSLADNSIAYNRSLI